ncbi:MAG TPA: peptidoglycan-binding domain-containing protein [Alphaproteobacteria bacterium]|nr:peptidoglycan-binding domain-containing protein [Alphaproteobacteria bacterium]
MRATRLPVLALALGLGGALPALAQQGVPVYPQQGSMASVPGSMPETFHRFAPEMAQAGVTAIQDKLRERGYYNGPSNGYVDPQTRQAIQRYQIDAQLQATGLADPELLNHLNFAPRVTARASAPIPSAAPAPTIRNAQELLKAKGYLLSAVDGKNGPKTRAAVRNYERDAGLPVDGVVDAQLMQHLATGSVQPAGYAAPMATPAPAAIPVIAPPPQSASVGQPGYGDPYVSRAQELLRQRGYYSGPITGIEDQGTRDAVIRYQQQYGLQATGRVSPDLLTQLGRS